MAKAETTSTRINGGRGRYEWQLLVPAGFEGEPATAVDVLERALAAIVEEGEWVQGSWFLNTNPDLDVEDAFCNSWQACADGFLIAVTVGALRTKSANADAFLRRWRLDEQAQGHGPKAYDLVSEARRALTRSSRTTFDRPSSEVMGSVPMINDHVCSTRTEAIQWFTDAIALAKEEAAAKEANVT